MAEFHALKPEPICPHCGHREKDAWEINFGPGLDGDAEVTCNSCGEEYHCSRCVSVSYTTRPLAGPLSIKDQSS
jgi:hypothetical protein